MNSPYNSNLRDEEQLRQLEWLVQLLDTVFVIPGTNYRIGFDGLLGLIPGFGDTVGTIFSSYIIYIAARLGASRLTLLRMVGNVAIESFIGIVPILGDIFDIAWKANTRNLALLRSQQTTVGLRPRSQRQVLWLITFAVVCIFLVIITLSIFLIRWMYQALQTLS
jgi:hypothetical protein